MLKTAPPPPPTTLSCRSTPRPPSPVTADVTEALPVSQRCQSSPPPPRTPDTWWLLQWQWQPDGNSELQDVHWGRSPWA